MPLSRNPKADAHPAVMKSDILDGQEDGHDVGVRRLALPMILRTSAAHRHQAG